VDANDPNEVAYEARKLNVSVEEIKEAIREVGNNREDIEGFFNRKQILNERLLFSGLRDRSTNS
ncbi:MAG: DUF3606 domain-containing protein, partial [Pedobacter sp.]